MNKVDTNYSSGVNPDSNYYNSGLSEIVSSNSSLKNADFADPFASSEGATIKYIIDDLVGRVNGMERQEINYEIQFGTKMCPTRHGCTGATNCNYDYGSYPG